MSEEKRTLEFSQEVKATAKQVYRAFTNAAQLENWLANVAEAQAQPEGRFYVWWNEGYCAEGQYTELEENQKVKFTWQGLGEPAVTKVKVTLEEDKGLTKVKVKHGGLGEGESWDKIAEEIKKGWEIALDNLKSVLETGLDQRVYSRPMLGVLPSLMIDAEEARKRGLEKDYGSHLSGVVEGMGAEAAGLKKDDIILSIDGVKLRDFSDFAKAIASHKAGDTVEVRFVRDKQEHKIDMVLSGRPLPEVPESAKALAKALREVYAELDKELDEIFAGVSDADALKRPGGEEWSAREVLAHLIMGEQWNQMYVTTLASDEKSAAYANHLDTYSAIAKAYPSNAAMLEAFKDAERITVAVVGNLPPEFFENKVSLHNLSVSLLQGAPYHSQPHFEQMRAAIEAARAEA